MFLCFFVLVKSYRKNKKKFKTNKLLLIVIYFNLVLFKGTVGKQLTKVYPKVD